MICCRRGTKVYMFICMYTYNVFIADMYNVFQCTRTMKCIDEFEYIRRTFFVCVFVLKSRECTQCEHTKHI